MSDTLPPLPEPGHRGPSGTGSYFDSYTADQMRSYAAEALAAAAPFQPDWDRVEALQESLREHMEEIRQLREQNTMLDATLAQLEAAAVAEPVAFKCWHPVARGFYLSTEPPGPTRTDTGEPDEYCGGRVEPLYAAPPQREPYDQTALGLCNACGWKAVGPDGCLNCAPQREREPLTDEHVFVSEDFMTANGLYWGLPMTTIMQIVRCTERAHGISAPASAPKEQ